MIAGGSWNRERGTVKKGGGTTDSKGGCRLIR
jgi:hypothetical protein